MEAQASRALSGVNQMQREEVAKKSHGRGNAHHGLTNKGEDSEKSHGLGVKMQHVDLVMFKHCAEEGGERGD